MYIHTYTHTIIFTALSGTVVAASIGWISPKLGTGSLHQTLLGEFNLCVYPTDAITNQLTNYLTNQPSKQPTNLT